MGKFQTIYDICYDTLYLVAREITNFYDDDEKIFLELHSFLTTDHTRFEEIFSSVNNFEFAEDKTYYKKIMMLIIASSSYCLACYQYDRDINTDINIEIINVFEKLTAQDIIMMFYDLENNQIVVDYVEDYLEFASKNYILRNSSLDVILKNGKANHLFKINPFEFIHFFNYINLNNLLTSEKFIQGFIDTYDASLSSIKDVINECFEGEGFETNNELFTDEEFDKNAEYNNCLIDIFKERINEHFHNDEKQIENFYRYIFSNIYETLIIITNNDQELMIKFADLLDLFSSCNCCFEELYFAFMNDNNIALMLINFFIDTNDYICEDFLMDKREHYKAIGNTEILRDLNPYYDEENIVFEQIKQKIKEYPD